MKDQRHCDCLQWKSFLYENLNFEVIEDFVLWKVDQVLIPTILTLKQLLVLQLEEDLTMWLDQKLFRLIQRASHAPLAVQADW